MALTTEQQLIGQALGYEPLTEEEGSEQYPAEVTYPEGPAVPYIGDIRRNNQGILRCFWAPQGGNYTAAESNELTGWYDVPDLEDIEEQVFDSVAYTPCGDEVEPDHVDSWLRILGLI
jgi:hypothetical protein